MDNQHRRIIGYRELNQAEPHEWLDKGTTDLQVGLMKLTRSIAQPAFF